MKTRLISLLLALALLLCGCGLEALPVSTQATGSVEGGLTVDFIDVGQADCALLECGGEYMLIDGGNRDDSSLVVSYLEQQGVEELAAVVCTHPHEDHAGGLPGVLAVYPTERILCPTRTYASACFDDFMYYADQQGLELEIPSPGDTFSLSGAVVTVLGPVKSYADTNNTSIVLKVQYGDVAFLFTGDMETEAENDLLDYWEGTQTSVQADVLKVGHHGSSTSTGYRLIYEVNPDYAVISVGADNSYGHPHEESLSRLNQAGTTIFRTDELGTVRAVTDGTELRFEWANSSADPENAESTEDIRFIGNVNSHKFHSSTCANLPLEKNQILFHSYQEAIAAGYTPCESCLG